MVIGFEPSSRVVRVTLLNFVAAAGTTRIIPLHQNRKDRIGPPQANIWITLDRVMTAGTGVTKHNPRDVAVQVSPAGKPKFG